MARYNYIPNRVIDTNGISDGASIFFYLSGTTTKISIYSTDDLSTPIANPHIVPAGAEVIPIYFAQDPEDIRVRVVSDRGEVISDDDPYDDFVTGSELGPIQDAIDALQGSVGSAIALGQFNRILSKLDSQSADANLVILTDSTGDETSEWIYLLFSGSVAAAYPEWTIKILYWSESSYAAATTIQTGTGTRTLTVWAAAVAGSIANRFAGTDFTAAVVTPTPDAVMLSYGHNADIQGVGPYTSATIRQLSWFNAIADRLDKGLPNVPVVMIGQNPTINNNGSNPAGTDDGFMRRRLELLFPLAARRGWGVINVHDAFLQSSTPLANLLVDSTHPNAAGSQLWADVVWGVMRASRGAQDAGGVVPGRLMKAWRSYADFNTWSKGNITLTQQTTAGRFETRPDAATATITSTAGLGYIYITAASAADMPALRGRYVTFAVWMHIPVASETNAGRIEIVDSGSTTVSQGPVRGDGFAVFTVTHLVDAAATSLVVNVYSAEAAFSPASVVDIDRASLSLGLDPIDPITAEDPVAAPTLPPFRGALVKKNADQTTANYAGGANVAWDAEVYDTDAFHDNVTNNTRLTVPSGVTKVRLSAQVRYSNGTNNEFAALAINKNGAGYDGQAYQVVASPTGAGSVSVGTGVLTVTAGDYFEANFQMQADTSITVAAGLSWFSIEVVE
ncbi:SGNH/GDSL hydrolase family protein [Sphingopyxis witflariensis]|uniref:Uncharacterized protein n=1 Tax=Sphingopyxis witflariensis TaxID=173675 RepID=A0A246JY56_9SPHN|nr:GDSL-type esterase/lipase family protein [Sphingopyxis witflariensis]OWQ98024.1 hypothetical protein CDQ91_10415 [Sphingopyxis witflariensis]